MNISFLRRCASFVFHALIRMREKILGLDFESRVDVYEEDHNYYSPTSFMSRVVLKKYFRSKITSSDAIIDVGCGKGKMLYFFSKFPFKKIRGLEYSQKIVNIAQKNIKILHLCAGGGRSYTR